MSPQQQKPVILIKLGGSIITNKEIPMQLRVDVLNRLVKEIVRARAAFPNKLFVVGHGSGSFAHVPATQYKTMNGFVNGESRLGMAIVQDSAAQLNRHVVHSFLEAGVPAVSLYPSNSLVTKNRLADSHFVDVFEEYIAQGLFPITGGDVILDRAQGCTIWSTEEVLGFFAEEFLQRGWQVEQLVHVTEVPGVFDAESKVIASITPETWQGQKQHITTTKGFDVTGGMFTKIEESLKLANKGINVKILSGLKAENLYQALTGNSWEGTSIQG